MKTTVNKTGKKVVKLIDSTVNLAVLILFIILFAFGCYGVWDSNQIYKSSEAKQYKKYKPTEENSLPFEEIKKINKDVLGWLSVYGTKVDYPLVQGKTNDKYLRTDVEGNYSAGGSIFLDYRSKNDFSDFNTLIHGHDMASGDMFGELKKFNDKEFFEKHQYGNLYHDEKDYGIEFFAFLQVDAYDEDIYNLEIKSKENKEKYIKLVYDRALNYRNIDIKQDDRIVMLSTCSFEITNGRHLLFGKIKDNVYENEFEEEESKSILEGINSLESKWYIVIFLLLLLILIIIGIFVRKKSSDK